MSWGQVHGDDVWLPDPPCEYIAQWYFDSGKCLSGANGIIPLTWQEIESFLRVNEIDALPWESETIRKMSESYCHWHSKTSSDNNIDPPIIPDELALKRIQAANGRRMKAMLKPSD